MEDKEKELKEEMQDSAKEMDEKKDGFEEEKDTGEDTGVKEQILDDRYIRELITQAEERGEIRGRNARIAELMREIHDSDGVPHPGSGPQSIRRPGPASIFDLAKYAK